VGDDIDSDPFDAVTAEPRVAIRRALAAHVPSNPDRPTLSFAALRTAAVESERERVDAE